MAEERIVVRLVLDSSGYKRGATEARSATDQIGGSVSKTDRSVGKLGGTFGKFGGVVAGAFAAKKIIDFGTAAVDRAEAMASAYAITEQVIKQTGGAANVTAEDIKKLSAEQAILTGIDKELITQSNNVLLTFKNVRNEVGEGNEIFDQASGLVLDMATTMGTDAKSGAIQLGKALNDPIAGVTALNRVGITFTDQQRDQIRTLTESGDVLGAQKIILAELEGQLGGTAEAAADTTAQIGNVFKEVQEQVGTVLLGALDELAPVIMDSIGTLGDALVPIAETIAIVITEVAPAVEGLVGATAAAAEVIGALAAALGPLLGILGDLVGFGLKPVTEFLKLTADGITAITSLWDPAAKTALRFSEAVEAITAAGEDGQAIYDAFANGVGHLARNGELTAETLADLAEEANVSEEAMAGALATNLEYARANGFAADQILVMEDALLKSIEATDMDAERKDELIEKYGLTDAAARSAAEGIEETGEAGSAAAGGLGETTDALEANEEAANAAKEAFREYMNELAESTNAALKASNSLADLRTKQDEVNKLAQEGKTDTDEYRVAQLELAAQVFETEEALAGFSGGTIEDAIGAISQALEISGAEARTLLEELGLLDGSEIRFGVEARFSSTGSSAAQDAFGSINRVSGAGGFRAEGGPVEAGIPYVVGEAGPEVFIPRESGMIVSNADTNTGQGSPVAGGDRNLNVTFVNSRLADDPMDGIRAAFAFDSLGGVS
jgi:hypothetical protein